MPIWHRLAKLSILELRDYQNFRRDHQTNLYERRDYESVDEESLAMSRKRLGPEKQQKKRIQEAKG